MSSFVWPNGTATQPRISSPFGPRTAPVPGASTYHRGTDFVGYTQVRAVAAGRVTVTGTPAGWSAGGLAVWIQHDGFLTRSMHLSSIAVRNGAWVEKGAILGVMGRTGNVSGIHQHLELVLNGSQINPVPWLASRISGGSSDWPARALYGEAWVMEIQRKLERLGYELGDIDGKDGPATQGAVRDFQGKNGLVADGVAGPLTNAKLDAKLTAPVGANQTSRPNADIQRLVGANVDGIWGPETTAKVMAWQQANGLVADGIWGPASDAKGFPVVTGPGGAPSPLLEVDGQRGKLTIQALQRSLGFTGADVDGELGPKTITALQKALGFTGADLDGILGPKTTKALQTLLGVHVDGEWGEQTTKALQQFLNAGTRITPVTVAPEKPRPAYPAVTARASEYPEAVRAWTVPLSFRLNEAEDAWVPDTRAGGKITSLVLHHTTNPGDEEPFFKTANSRGSCPTGYVTAGGLFIGLIPLTLRPSSTGDGVNEFSAALEIQNTKTAPNWETSEAALERVADYAAWLASKNGQDITVDGVTVRVEFTLDRDHIFGDQEATAKTGIPVRATACPGPFIMSRMDWIVDRARVLLATKYAPAPEPEPEPEPGKTVSPAFVQSLTFVADSLNELVEELTE